MTPWLLLIAAALITCAVVACLMAAGCTDDVVEREVQGQ